ncbi:hypothetical protein C0995_001852 [Termitomyces sp. Mi166|nr:hypothetical protein C0995_001852 [Termitomyces sp. Mi166\
MSDHPSTLDLNTSKDGSVSDIQPDHHREQVKMEEPNTLSMSKNKGKGRQCVKYSVDGVAIKVEENEDTLPPDNTPYPTCNICTEAFILTHSPINAALSANSSNRLPFGLRLPCPKEHPYCISCLTSYIQSKLDPDGLGVGKSSATVFPIRCPECPMIVWPEGIDDDVAQRVLGEDAPSTTEGKCKSNPPCELWDEERLLEQREREGNRVAVEQQPAPQAIFVDVAPGVPQVHHPVVHHDDLHWINDPGTSFIPSSP